MARPDNPRMSVATDPSLILASSKTLWRRLATRVCSACNCRAIAGVIAQLPLPAGRNETAPQQPGLQQLCAPLRVAQVAFASRHLLHMGGIGEDHGEAGFQDVEDRFPEHPVDSIPACVTPWVASQSAIA